MTRISPQFLARLRRLRIVYDSKRTGMQKGIRSSHRFGSSLEFSDFKEFQPGDDIRQIDWNVYGRTRRHFIKRYLDEQEIKVAIYLDCTSSMRAIESKWTQAKSLAACLSFICLENEDRLSFIPISAPSAKKIERKGRTHAQSVLLQILRLSMEETTTSFIRGLEGKMEKNTQIAFIITDGMEPIEEYERLLKKCSPLHTNIIFIQILSEKEGAPEVHGDAKLIDSELQTEINLSVSPRLITAYQMRLQEHNERLKQLCVKTGAEYFLINDVKKMEEILLKDFVLKGLVQKGG
ncbi:DUF58 domain-containing protein [Lederbergia sp. NSJ-179]|uniref:DUF58 domain-containing protein n=1 Tax=Lederbergia sp. NSJ-179 TaxID=2931402 RepID=UPI001FCFEF32|nr:DUF58 domain-containing protein [Lederbergia sp. NSJ-179]MCJ7841701.1 DUF58 domain-containing protein [Lederbergia sp. NSJ-179]